MSHDIKSVSVRSDVPQRFVFPDPIDSWLKMLLFGAAVGAMASVLSALWGVAQVMARSEGMPTRRTMNLFFPYVTLGMAACSWMAVWALTSVPPTSGDRFRNTLSYWRTVALRLLVTSSFLILSLRLSGLMLGGLRPPFNGTRTSLLMLLCDVAVTILLWAHLRWIAAGQKAVVQRFKPLVGRSVIVLIGRSGTLILMFLIPALFDMAHHSLQLPWVFLNIRSCAVVFWDVMAAMVLIKFVFAFLADGVQAHR